jgi:pimeloyl-ACP methyl ester carboxylesterase
MCHHSKLTQLLILALIATLVSCSPAATPIPPTATPTSIPPTATNLPPPTSTPEPTSTVPPRPTSTPGPVSGKFDAGGVKLNIVCFGEGSPTVVFDAGWGVDWSTWSHVMLELKPHTHVCAYDRASMGQSDSQTGLRTSGQIAEQLHTLLASAGVDGPYLVVGHSIGGMNMLVFADRYRGEVAGVVLVDSAHPDQADRWLALLPTPAPDEPTGLAELRTGIPWSNPEDPSFPEPMDWEKTLAQVRAVKSLSSTPLAVLVAVDPQRNSWGDIPPELAASLDKVWLDLHKQYLNLSTDSSLILAKKSGHYIQDDEPQVVIDAILKLVDKARQK